MRYNKIYMCDAAHSRPLVQPPPDFIKLWVMRALFDLQAYKHYAENIADYSLRLAYMLEAETYYHDDDRKVGDIIRHLERLRSDVFPHLDDTVTLPHLVRNVRCIADVAGFTEAEVALLQFAILMHSDALLASISPLLGEMTRPESYRALSVMLGLPRQTIRRAFLPDSSLRQTGLLATCKQGTVDLEDLLELECDELADFVYNRVANPVDQILKHKVIHAGKPDLQLADFAHLEQPLQMLTAYLRRSVETHKPGVNILLYGPPGTGKTQFTRVLAKQLGCKLYEIAGEDENGDPVSGPKRLGMFRVAQSFAKPGSTVFAFEEINDVLSESPFRFFFSKAGGTVSKAAIVRILETNRIPTIWVSNYINHLDPAYLRRFDVVLYMPSPPMSQRQKILQRACRGIAPQVCIKRLAQYDEITPAVVTRAASVVRAVGDELDAADNTQALEQLVESTLRAQGHRLRLGRAADSHPDYYAPEYSNTDLDANELADGLRRTGEARLCLYGPPGTGKTAFGLWLAKQLDKQLTVKRASDLLSPYIGETEINLATAFDTAARDDAVLMIDEVDSFLQSRTSAHHSWEVTQVNEFLTQLEHYHGIFIASTNLMDDIDPAAMRRFDIKAKFDYLRTEQAWKLFVRLCRRLKLSTRSKRLQSKLGTITCLTPGDFTVIARTHRFRPFDSAAAVIDALAQECLHKTAGRQNAIGFIRQGEEAC